MTMNNSERTTDNNYGNYLIKKNSVNDLEAIANRNLFDLQIDNPDLLIFPQSLGKYHDDIEKSYIFSLNKEKLTTYNIMGFVGRNDTKLTIASRFANDDKNDYFLHYMLQRIFAINILNFDQTPAIDNIWDFLLYLFPYFLKKAYSQGMYKSYRCEKYNDANVKGNIDVKCHIRTNIPFAGRIAYTTREHSHDNPVTQLIRHTIEHIKVHPWGSGILTGDNDIRDIVSKICFVTQKSYNKNERQKLMSFNLLKPVSHTYFTEYKTLQKLCLRILHHDKLIFGNEKDKIYGLLFDGAWLWEEYLNKLLIREGFEHAENKRREGSIQIFSDNNHFPRYPDFYKNDLVLDAKYQKMEPTKIDRNDIHQIITYMYIRKAKIGGFIYPEKTSGKENPHNVGMLKGYGNVVNLYHLTIPQNNNIQYAKFKEHMNHNEKQMTDILKSNK